MSASVLVGLLCVVAIAALGGVVVRNKSAEASPRNKAIWSLAAWSVVVVAGLAIWLIARAQISN
jgi:hypothetical protein